MVEVFAPVEEHRVGDMSELIVCCRVIVDFHDSSLGVVEVFMYPFGVYQHFGLCILHMLYQPPSITFVILSTLHDTIRIAASRCWDSAPHTVFYESRPRLSTSFWN